MASQVINAIGMKPCGRQSVQCNLSQIPRRFAYLANVPTMLAGEELVNLQRSGSDASIGTDERKP